MSRSFFFWSAAKRDVDRYTSRMSDYDRKSGRRFFMSVRNAYARLAQMPGLGGLYESSELGLAQLRVWPIPNYENYLIFYREVADGIEVVREIYGGMDLDVEFEREPRRD